MVWVALTALAPVGVLELVEGERRTQPEQGSAYGGVRAGIVTTHEPVEPLVVPRRFLLVFRLLLLGPRPLESQSSQPFLLERLFLLVAVAVLSTEQVIEYPQSVPRPVNRLLAGLPAACQGDVSLQAHTEGLFDRRFSTEASEACDYPLMDPAISAPLLLVAPVPYHLVIGLAF